jgi:hypothetical protein
MKNFMSINLVNLHQMDTLFKKDGNYQEETDKPISLIIIKEL